MVNFGGKEISIDNPRKEGDRSGTPMQSNQPTNNEENTSK